MPFVVPTLRCDRDLAAKSAKKACTHAAIKHTGMKGHLISKKVEERLILARSLCAVLSFPMTRVGSLFCGDCIH